MIRLFCMNKTTNKLAFTLFALLCLSCITLISSCSKFENKGNLVQIGINQWIGYDPFILAESAGLFKKNNVSVKINRFASAKDVLKSLIKGEIQGAGLTLDEVFSAIDSGFKGKVVLIVDYSKGGDMLIGQSQVKSMADLEGKTVGYEGSIVGEFLLNRALQINHVKRTSVKLVDVPADKWLGVFIENGIDALVCFDPIATTLLNNHEGNLLFSSAEIPFEIIDVLLVSESFYDDNKVDITNIIRAWFDAVKYIDSNLDEAAEIISSVRETAAEEYKGGLNKLVFPDVYRNSTIMNDNSDINIYKLSQVIVDFMLSEGLLSKRINTNTLFPSEFLSEIESTTEVP